MDNFPLPGEVFKLTAKSDITSISLVVECGYDPRGWRTSAKTLRAGTTGSFRLLAVGHQTDLDAVTLACVAKGAKKTNGCWLKVFDRTFRRNVQNQVGVPDASWKDPRGNPSFPSIGALSGWKLRWDIFSRNSAWLWLVEV